MLDPETTWANLRTSVIETGGTWPHKKNASVKQTHGHTPRKTWVTEHRIIEEFGLERPFKGHLVQPQVYSRSGHFTMWPLLYLGRRNFKADFQLNLHDKYTKERDVVCFPTPRFPKFLTCFLHGYHFAVSMFPDNRNMCCYQYSNSKYSVSVSFASY